jgi:hypothetical protein
VPKSAGLYAILDKVSKIELQKHPKSLSLVRYTGTVTNTSIEDRFTDHRKPKNAGSKRFVFNPQEYCIVSIMTFDTDSLEERFETSDQAAVAYEMLSDCLRKECNFVSCWAPGK